MIVRKFYDRFVDSSIGSYKDVDGDWHEYHKPKNKIKLK